MSKYIRTPAKIVAVVAVTAIPSSLLAGAYGESAVRDSRVANTASNQAMVPCARLNRNIPANLAADMDCGSSRAAPAVAGERVRNGPVASFFDRFRHKRNSGPPASNDDGPNTGDTSSRPPVTTVSSDPSGPSSPTPTPTDDGGGDGGGGTPTANVGKWDRLGDFGVTRENYNDQPTDLQQQITDFRTSNPGDADWSAFSPD